MYLCCVAVESENRDFCLDIKNRLFFCWHQYENKEFCAWLTNDSQPSFLPRHPNRPTSYWPRCRTPFAPLLSAGLRHVWGPVIWAAVSIHEPRQLVKWGRKGGKWGENVWDRVRFVLLLLRISDHFLVLWFWAVKIFKVSCVMCCSAASVRDCCIDCTFVWRRLLVITQKHLRLCCKLSV